jgi:hypothetical protein
MPAATPPEPVEKSEPAISRPTQSLKHLVLTAVILVVIVALLVVAAQVFDSNDQSAANWINGVAAALSGLNVALTFFILRAAFGQLAVLHQDMESQEARHNAALLTQEQRRLEEAEQAKAELARQEQRHAEESARAQAQLAIQTTAAQIAQESARQAQREAARTRLDLTAPRCSVELASVSVNLYRRETKEPRLIDEDTRLDEDVEAQLLEVSLTFNIRNWTNAPITYSLGSPWENVGSHILYPETPHTLFWNYRASVDHWMRMSQGEASIGNINGVTKDSPTLVTLWVPVSNLENTVNDMHRWDSHIMPITINRLSVIAHPGSQISKYCRKITYFERDWVPLQEPSE